MPGPERPGSGLSGRETVVVVVVMSLAAALALAGLPMFGALEFVGGAAYLACRTVEGLRESRPATAWGF